MTLDGQGGVIHPVMAGCWATGQKIKDAASGINDAVTGK
jgi:hypothetical protein